MLRQGGLSNQGLSTNKARRELTNMTNVGRSLSLGHRVVHGHYGDDFALGDNRHRQNAAIPSLQCRIAIGRIFLPQHR
jgi:hypothetical protein